MTTTAQTNAPTPGSTLAEVARGIAPAGEVAPEVRDAAVERAAEMLRATGGDAEGMQHLHNLALSLALPAIRALLRAQVASSKLSGRERQEALAAIKNISPVTETGCMRIDFHNAKTLRPDVAYLRMDQCPRTHDLGRQLAKLQPLVAPEKWPGVLRALSHLQSQCRWMYGGVAREHLALLRKIHAAPPTDGCEKYLAPQVDASNVTLYFDAECPSRVGFYISLESELGR